MLNCKCCAVTGHRYEICGAQRKHDRGDCTRPAGWGTDHPGIGRCKLHGGSTPSHQRAATIVEVRRECERLGFPIEIDQGDALIARVWEAEGNLAFYRSQVQALESVVGTEYGAEGARKEVPKVLVALYHEAERWSAQVSALALKAGVDERRQQLAEIQVRGLFDSIGRAAVAAGLSHEVTGRFLHELAQDLRRTAEPASLAG